MSREPGAVQVIFTEMIHDARIVPLDGRPALPEGIRLWMGDSRGHWDGDTLVVETTNFTDKRGGPRFSDRLLRWSPDPTGGIWNATKETELPG